MDNEAHPKPIGSAEQHISATPTSTRMLSADILERLVYLVGTTRSGTTVIARSFYLSGYVFGCPNSTRFTNQVWRNRNKVDERMLRLIFKMPKFYQERRALNALAPEDRTRIRRLIWDAFATRHLGRMYQLYPLLYSLDPACAKDPSQALCWADKANDVEGLFDLPRYLPQAKFVFITRDPRAATASMKGQVVRTRQEAGLAGRNLTALFSACIYWRNMMQTFLRFARRYPDRSIFIRYEDFVDAPEEAINRLLDFAVGDRMAVDALQAGISQFRHKRKHDKHTATGAGIDRRPLDRWRRMLEAPEAELTTALTWRTARKLGYEIDAPRGRFTGLKTLAQLKGWRTQAISSAKLAYLEAKECFIPNRTGLASAGTALRNVPGS